MLVYILLAVFALQLVWYLISLLALYKIEKGEGLSQSHPISLIISARNEEENLLENIPKWLDQTHPNFEIVIIDDRSFDHTFDIIGALASKDDRITRVQVVEYKNSSVFFGKKYALTMGIKQAKHEHLVFTDADCIPSDNNFLERFDFQFSKGKNLILGTGSFNPDSGFLNLWMRLDNLKIAITYFVFAFLKSPYMGVGRSFGYTKSLFYSVKGFASHQNIESGDDDLFLQSVKQEAQIGLSVQAVTLSNSASSLKTWLSQKKRHYSTSSKYPNYILFFLWMLELLSILGILLTPALFLNDTFIPIIMSVLVLFFLKLIMSSVVLYKLSSLTGQRSLAGHNLFMEPLLSSLNALFSTLMLFTKQQGWKRRI